MDLYKKQKKEKALKLLSSEYREEGVQNSILLGIFGVPVLFLLLFSFSISSVSAAAASMFLTPAVSSYVVGQTFPVLVQVNTTGTSINAAEGVISYNSALLSVVSISKGGTIFSLWTDEPRVTSLGNIAFGGGIPNPGYTGSSGRIISVTFRAKSPGSARVNFVSGSVLANDGLGTNVLSTLGGSTYTIIPSTSLPKSTPTPQSSLDDGDGPQIASVTHPDQDLWYRSSTATFEWGVTSNIEGVRLLIGKLARVTPTVTYIPPISSKTIEDLDDGVWYFHAQFKEGGSWGSSSHFRVNVDTMPPEEFTLRIDNEDDPTNPSPLLKFKTEDETSGIARYEISIDGGETISVETEKVTAQGYRSPLLLPGSRLITVTAFDQAENFTKDSASVIIEPIQSPVITAYPKYVRQSDQLIVEGTSLGGTKVHIWISKEGDESIVGSASIDEERGWRYVHTGSLDRGTYDVYAIAEDTRGAKSMESERVTVTVMAPLFINFGNVAIDYLATMITLILLIVVGVLAVAYTWFKVTRWRSILRKEVSEVDASVTAAFRALNEETQEQFETLQDAKKKRTLTKEEKHVLKHLKESMKVAEYFIKKEIKDVKKEIK